MKLQPKLIVRLGGVVLLMLAGGLAHASLSFTIVRLSDTDAQIFGSGISSLSDSKLVFEDVIQKGALNSNPFEANGFRIGTADLTSVESNPANELILFFSGRFGAGESASGGPIDVTLEGSIEWASVGSSGIAGDGLWELVAVPAPATVGLLGFSLLALAGLAVRRQATRRRHPPLSRGCWRPSGPGTRAPRH